MLLNERRLLQEVYFVKRGYNVVLNFWTTSSSSKGFLCGRLSFGLDGILKLEWPLEFSMIAVNDRSCKFSSTDVVKNIITLIIQGSTLMRGFTYGSPQETSSNRDMLRLVLNFLEGSSEQYISRSIKQKVFPQLRVLRLPNHNEKQVETLIDLLEKTRIEELDISQWKLLPETELEKLFRALYDCPSIRKLCIAENRIHTKALKLLGSWVAYNVNLEELDMGSLEDKLTVKSIKEFIDGIDEINPTLTKISFGNTEITGAEWEASVIKPLREKLPNCQITVCLASE